MDIKNKKQLFLDERKPLLIDKPLGWTSFDVIRKLRKILGIRKIGHAGTLDPLATGLLILCFNKGTKTIESYQAYDKAYEGRFFLGKRTPSFDGETKCIKETTLPPRIEDRILPTSKKFIGTQQQRPPIFSACKVGGVAAYKKARKGKSFLLKKKTIIIKNFTITKVELPIVFFKVDCSKGTYIRSLANDFGNSLGVGAYLYSLRRLSIGPYSIDKAFTLEKLQKKLN